MRRPIAAPIPRVPPVTNATLPPSSPVPAQSARACGSMVVDIRLCLLSAWSVVRALGQPCPELGPDLVLGLGARHEADVAARARQVRDVLAGDEVQQRDRRLTRGDVVGAGGHDKQVLLDAPQVDALPAQLDAAADEPVLLVHPRRPLPPRLARERRDGWLPPAPP